VMVAKAGVHHGGNDVSVTLAMESRNEQSYEHPRNKRNMDA